MHANAVKIIVRLMPVTHTAIRRKPFFERHGSVLRAAVLVAILDETVSSNGETSPDICTSRPLYAGTEQASSVFIRSFGIELDAQSDTASEWAPVLQAADGVRCHLLVQLRSQGLFRGFLDFQSQQGRQWSETEVTAVQQVAAMLSIIVVDAFMLSQSNADISNLAAVVETLTLFREEPDPFVAASKSAAVLAKSFGSKQSRLYLFDPESNTLLGHDESLSLTDSENPFVSVFNQAQPMILNPASIATSHQKYFGIHRGVLVPLRAEEKTLGVLAFWERSPELKPFQPQERPVAFWLAAHLAKCIAFSACRNS
jgi:hypothetical protein